jgi:ubiquinone/menaquinone biosynthesis C-methylase UbiE
LSNNSNHISGKGYDRITSVYDIIACVFSFNKINKSQLALLSHLDNQKTALILGGGTGYFLHKMLEQNKTIQITYVDVSAKMIAHSKKRIEKNCPNTLNRVTFICKAIEDLDWQTYDVIVCNYILDLFDDAGVQPLAKKFHQHLNPQGLLYVTDFQIPETNALLKWFTKTGLKILSTFFRYTTELRTKQLPEIDKLLKEQGFSVLDSKSYLSGILMCRIYTI